MNKHGADWVLIRADASQDIGYGHIMRCLTLADRLAQSGVGVAFVCRHISTELVNLINASDCTLILLSEAGPPPESDDFYSAWLGTSQSFDAAETLERGAHLVEESGVPAYVIVDHYALDATWEGMVSEALGCEIVVVDDLSNRHHRCKMLVDTTYGKTNADYNGLVEANTEFLIGSRYALLRPQFSELRQSGLRSRDNRLAAESSVKTILIAMGGIDKPNLTCMALNAVNDLDVNDTLKVDILIGGSFPHLEKLEAQILNVDLEVSVHQQVSNVSDLVNRSDLCIGAAGSSTWERCALGAPTVNVVIAKNQYTIAQKLNAAGAILNAGFYARLTPEMLTDKFLTPLLKNPRRLRDMSIAARRICDGRGADRVAKHLFPFLAKNGAVHLRKAKKEDIETVYEWQSLPETRKYANNPEVPSWEEHNSWMEGKLADSTSDFFIVRYQDQDVGVVRLDAEEIAFAGAFIISIFIHPSQFGQGVASAALKLVANMRPKAVIRANVLDRNKASISLFRQAGYEPEKPEWYVYRQSGK